MLSVEQPADFKKRYDIVGCYILCQDRFIMLLRHAHKASGGTWQLPAGKVEPGENLHSAIAREVKEETGIELNDSDVSLFGSYYVRDGNFDYRWHMFSTELDEKPEVKINPYEHSEYRWVSREEALKLNLIHDQGTSMEIFFTGRK